MAEQKKLHATIVLETTREERPDKTKSSISNRTSFDTLKLLHKVIFKEKNSSSERELGKDPYIEVEANRLPLIQKEGTKKERVVAQYDPKYKWQPQEYQTKEEVSRLCALKYRKKRERPEIRGWDQNISI